MIEMNWIQCVNTQKYSLLSELMRKRLTDNERLECTAPRDSSAMYEFICTLDSL